MGNGMMCATTSKPMVSQGVADTGKTGAPPPLAAVVVSQSGLSQGGVVLVPISPINGEITVLIARLPPSTKATSPTTSLSTCLKSSCRNQAGDANRTVTQGVRLQPLLRKVGCGIGVLRHLQPTDVVAGK
jgi:hypothetical protein